VVDTAASTTPATDLAVLGRSTDDLEMTYLDPGRSAFPRALVRERLFDFDEGEGAGLRRGPARSSICALRGAPCLLVSHRPN
jgi:hypothetical protein